MRLPPAPSYIVLRLVAMATLLGNVEAETTATPPEVVTSETQMMTVDADTVTASVDEFHTITDQYSLTDSKSSYTNMMDDNSTWSFDQMISTESAVRTDSEETSSIRLPAAVTVLRTTTASEQSQQPMTDTVIPTSETLLRNVSRLDSTASSAEETTNIRVTAAAVPLKTTTTSKQPQQPMTDTVIQTSPTQLSSVSRLKSTASSAEETTNIRVTTAAALLRTTTASEQFQQPMTDTVIPTSETILRNMSRLNSTASPAIICGFCELGKCSNVSSATASMNSTNSSNNSISISSCASNTRGICYVLYDLASNAVALGCNSSVNSQTKCISEYASSAANGRCEFCCTTPGCNRNYGSHNVQLECVNMLRRSGAEAGMMSSSFRRHHWLDAAALVITAVLTWPTLP